VRHLVQVEDPSTDVPFFSSARGRKTRRDTGVGVWKTEEYDC
jgi:hypothetical protein